ncbi:MAG: Cys-tRNA(Pro) deacylase [Campylobacteraceae bacterium]|nr:Cys-tRNA(Pro) deacylase [Campylobacteraceae bacterium]
MTPAINIANKAKINYTIHEYQHDTDTSSYGEEAALKLNINQDQVFKTLLVELSSKELAVAVLPVSHKLSIKSIASSMGQKKALMANKDDAQRSTGYLLGGISALGQKKRLKTIIDNSALNFDTIYISAGKRGLEIELNPNDLAKLLNAKFELITLAI